MRSRMNAPHEFIYFTDRDLGHQFPEKLRAAGIPVERHDSHFGQLTTDPEWLAEIGRRGWVAISRDARIRYSPLALETLMDAGVRLFVIVGRLTTHEAAELFIHRRGQIEDLLKRESGPFIGKIKRDGVEVWLRRSEWRRKARPQPKRADAVKRAAAEPRKS
jgi:PIN domain-containing protein